MRQDDEIEDLFRSAFTDFEVAPPPSIKEAIDREIGLMQPRKRRGGWWWAFSLIGFLFVASACYFIYRSMGNTDSQLVAESDSTQAKTSSNYNNQDAAVAGKGQRKSGADGASEKTTTAGQSPVSAGDENIERNRQSGNPMRETAASKSDQQLQKDKQVNYKKSAQSKSGKVTKPDAGKTKNQSNTNGASKKGSWRFGKGKSKAGVKAKSGPTDGNPGILNASSATGGGGTAEPGNMDASTLGTVDTKDPEKSVASPAKGDSTKTVIDSTKQVNPVTPPDAGKGKQEDNNKANWLLSLRGGPTFWPGESADGIQKNKGWAVQAGISRTFWGKSGLSSGLELESWRESLKKVETTTKKEFLFTVDVPIYDPQNPDSIIGYDLDSIYATHSKTSVLENKNQVFAVNIPLYFRYSEPIIGNFIMDINAGVVLAYQKSVNKMVPIPPDGAPPLETDTATAFGSVPQTTHSFGAKLIFQPHLRYQFNQFGVSVFTNIGYDLLPAVRYEGYKPLQLFGTIGVGLHWEL